MLISAAMGLKRLDGIRRKAAELLASDKRYEKADQAYKVQAACAACGGDAGRMPGRNALSERGQGGRERCLP